MAKVDENHERLKKNRWLRALQLARILFDDEGYFTYYLDQIEKFVKNTHLEINGSALELGIKKKEIMWVGSRRCEDCHDCQTFNSKDAALLTISLATGRLSYSLDIGKPFPFHHATVIVCTEKGQMICKIQRPDDKHDITN